MPTDPIPYGYCHCGCGQKTRIAKATDHRCGHIKGEPVRFLKAHHHRGKTVSAETRAKLRQAVGQGARRPNWKGDRASYRAIHSYLGRHFPKTGICDKCGEATRTVYALIHGRKYSRDRADYREMCHRCHMQYDLAGVPRDEREGLVARHHATHSQPSHPLVPSDGRVTAAHIAAVGGRGRLTPHTELPVEEGKDATT